jgi:hypothetical protein
MDPAGAVHGLYGCRACAVLFPGAESFLLDYELLKDWPSNPCPKCVGESYQLELEGPEDENDGEEIRTQDTCPNCKTGKIILNTVGCWD